MSFTPLEPFSLMTLLGSAICTGLYVAHDPEWLCWVNSTQEPWWFGNPFVRRRMSVTNGHWNNSPFARINKPLQKQIERYKNNGWLPQNYDPEDTSTWPT